MVELFAARGTMLFMHDGKGNGPEFVLDYGNGLMTLVNWQEFIHSF